jgi:phosphoserine phosphatase
VAPGLAVDVWRANRLRVADDVLTGEVAGTIVDAAAKAETLRAWAADSGVPLARTLAIGDGANDLQMLAAAGLGVAFNAKPAVRARADLVVGPVDLAQVIPLLP